MGILHIWVFGTLIHLQIQDLEARYVQGCVFRTLGPPKIVVNIEPNMVSKFSAPQAPKVRSGYGITEMGEAAVVFVCILEKVRKLWWDTFSDIFQLILAEFSTLYSV